MPRASGSPGVGIGLSPRTLGNGSGGKKATYRRGIFDPRVTRSCRTTDDVLGLVVDFPSMPGEALWGQFVPSRWVEAGDPGAVVLPPLWVVSGHGVRQSIRGQTQPSCHQPPKLEIRSAVTPLVARARQAGTWAGKRGLVQALHSISAPCFEKHSSNP